MGNELAAELRRLAGLKPARKTLEAITKKLAELTDHAEGASAVTEALHAAVTSMQELQQALCSTDADNPLTAGITLDDIEKILTVLPGGDSDNPDGANIASLLEDAENAASGCEEIFDSPRDYVADAKAEAWGELADALDAIANYLEPKEKLTGKAS